MHQFNFFKKTVAQMLILTLILSTFSIKIYAYNNSFSGGSGTANDPYIISTAADFQKISLYPKSSFVQSNDISFKDISYSPIGTNDLPFSGTYNGNGFKITDITIDSENLKYIGLFGLSSGTITNVSLSNSTIKGYSNSTTIYGGGIVGYNNGTITNCSVNSQINISVKLEETEAYSGGICGYSKDSSTVLNCNFNGAAFAQVLYINSTSYCGGICGYGQVQNCTNSGTITSKAANASTTYAGGIVGSGKNINNCYNEGNVSSTVAATALAGGIAAYGSNIKSCKNTAEVYANVQYRATGNNSLEDAFSGGIVGINDGDVSYCENSGTIHGDSLVDCISVGGIAGLNDGVVQNSKNTGYIYTTESVGETEIGGIAGASHADTYVKYCLNEGTVCSNGNKKSLPGFSGGIVGCLIRGSIIQCCNFGDVSINSQYAPETGGIVGEIYSSGVLIDCFNTGNISIYYNGEYSWNAGNCGGICGATSNVITNCYSTGLLTNNNITSPSKLGGIIGKCSLNNLENCYTQNLYDDTLATQMSESELKNIVTYEGFDFDDIWSIDTDINNGYPYLKAIPLNDNPNWYTQNTNMSVEAIKISNLDIQVIDGYVLADISVTNMNNEAKIYVAAYNSVGNTIEIKSPVLINNSAQLIFTQKNICKLKAFILSDNIKPLSGLKEKTVQYQ